MDEPADIHDHSEAKSEVAQHKMRDEHGHFVHTDPTHPDFRPLPEQHPTIPVPIQIEKTNDDNTLVDVHVNNPLKKFLELLQAIKRQKAFSFSIRGSVGITGVALVLTTFGIFGGTKAFCGKGVQSYAGTVRVLQYPKTTVVSVPIIDRLRNLVFGEPEHVGKRVVLMTDDAGLIQIKSFLDEEAQRLTGQQVIVTGEYDSCVRSINATDENAVELLQQ